MKAFSKSRIIKQVCASLLCLSLLISTFGCSSSATNASSAAGKSSNAEAGSSSKTTLTVSQSTDTTTLDPQKQGKMPSMNILINIFDTLVTRDNNNNLQPSLATDWKTVNDTTWQFKLRKGVKFQDGEDFNAAAVKYSIERLLDPKTKSPIVELSDVKEVDVVDDYTVNIVTKTPDPILPNKIVLFGGVIVPPQYIKEKGDDYFAKHPVGTGPFKFVSWEKDNKIELEANADYWGGAPSVQKLIIRIIPNAADVISALKTGEVDLAYDGITSDVAAELQSSSNVKVETIPWIRTFYINIDTQSKTPLADQKVRQALNYAIDVPTMIKTILGGEAHQVSTLIPAQNFGYDKSVGAYSYDPAKAKELLAQAGYPDGFSTKLDATSEDASVVQAIAGQLSQVGVKVTVNLMDSTTLVSNIKAKKASPLYFMGNTGWTMDALSNFQSYVRSDRRYNRFPSTQLDKLVDIEEQTIDSAARQKAFTQIQQILKEQAPYIFLYQKDLQVAMQKNVSWATNSIGIMKLSNVKIG